MTILKKLNRLFRSNPNNDFLAELHSKSSKPLLVHPQIGQAVLQSYLTMVEINYEKPKQEMGDGVGSSVYVTKMDNIAVLDISGTLTDREMSVPCMRSPVSYEAIKMEMRELIADQSIDTIIARLDTPGGVANQNMDLSDFIYSSRDQGTRLIACVDDMAYSAGFGIASAFEEIWITRTGGIGSVGVVSYHEDHSQALAKKGVKVEYIYAGDKKVFGNPAEPLSDEARRDFQFEVSRIYNIFTGTVARNMGMTIDDVKDTQAGIFHGQDAIDIGFAHKLGTFDDLIAELTNEEFKSELINSSNGDTVLLVNNKVKPEMNDGESGDEENKPKEEVSGSPSLEQNFEVEITDNVKQEAEDTYKSSIKALCLVAGKPEASTAFIESKMSVDDVRDNLMTITDNSEKTIVSTKSLKLVDDKKKQIVDGWSSAINRVNK